MNDMIREEIYKYDQAYIESLLDTVSDRLGIDRAVLTTSNIINIMSFDIDDFCGIELKIGDKGVRNFDAVMQLIRTFEKTICTKHISDDKLWYVFHTDFYSAEEDKVISGDIVVRFDNQDYEAKDNAALNLAESEARHASEYATDHAGHNRYNR